MTDVDKHTDNFQAGSFVEGSRANNEYLIDQFIAETSCENNIRFNLFYNFVQKLAIMADCYKCILDSVDCLVCNFHLPQL